MNAKKHFEKHYAKLRLEALSLSILSALVIGLWVGFATALSTWFLKELNGMWLSIGSIVAVTLIATPIFYFKKYRPTAIGNARRIDRLGLEERLVTMVDYEQDDSYIAALQREDAKATLDKLESSRLKLKLPKKLLILLIVSGVFGIGMTAVTTLSDFGILPGGTELLEELLPEEQIKYASVTYDVEEGGSIDGESDQLIPLGGSSEQIVAVADDGYEFVEWDDGYKKPVRSDKNITEDVIFIAIFAPIDAEGDGEGDPSDQESDQEKPSDEPKENSQSEQNKPEDEESENPSSMGGGKYEEANQIIDGETYYREVLELYKELLKERLETEGDQLTDEERAIIEAYLGLV